MVVVTVIAVFIVLKLAFALFSALFGALLFLGVIALLGIGAYSVVQFVTRGRRVSR